MTKRFQQAVWFGFGLVVGMTALSVSYASLPPAPTVTPGQITDDTALYQKMSEIHVRKETNPSFDGDISRLSQTEGRYREELPILARSPRLRTPLERIQKTKYRYSASKTSSSTTSSN